MMAQTVRELVELSRRELFADRASAAALCDADVLCMGTDAGEWWDGREEVLDALDLQAEQIGLPTHVPEGDLRVRERGDVGWFAEHASFAFGEGEVRIRLTNIPWRVLSSGDGLGVGSAVGPGGVLVVVRASLQAAVEDADEPVRELAQGGARKPSLSLPTSALLAGSLPVRQSLSPLPRWTTPARCYPHRPQRSRGTWWDW